MHAALLARRQCAVCSGSSIAPFGLALSTASGRCCDRSCKIRFPRQAELLRDLLNLLVAQGGAKLFGRHGKVRARAKPGRDLRFPAAAAQLLHKAGKIAKAGVGEHSGEAGFPEEGCVPGSDVSVAPRLRMASPSASESVSKILMSSPAVCCVRRWRQHRTPAIPLRTPTGGERNGCNLGSCSLFAFKSADPH